MSTEKEIEIIFGPDETLGKLDPTWSLEQLLDQEKVFFGKDVAPLLGVSARLINRVVDLAEAQEINPWERYGIRKIWNHWILKMGLFAPFYQEHLRPHLPFPMKEHWDANQLLAQQGTYALRDVCKKIPISRASLEKVARNNPNSREDFGIWKNNFGEYLVSMERFAPWIKSIWTSENRAS